jgi:hypothetical protein
VPALVTRRSVVVQGASLVRPKDALIGFRLRHDAAHDVLTAREGLSKRAANCGVLLPPGRAELAGERLAVE